MDIITKQDAHHILFHFGADYGFEPGSFTKNLIRAYAAAGANDRAKLAAIYPGVAAAYNMADKDENGIVKLQELVTKA